MKIFRQIDEVPAAFGQTVLSVGNFDGVHRAHQEVLRHVIDDARKQNTRAMAVTFDPHPTRILRSDAAPKLITPIAQKLKLLQQTGIDAALVIPFTQELSISSPEEFARILHDKLKAVAVHEGANFRFGHRAEGTVRTLEGFGHRFGFGVRVYPEMKVRGETVSSSRIRELLQRGKVSLARALLGRVFSVVANPAPGRGYGSKYTVPTINLGRYDELLPGNGVYITRTRVGKEIFDSVTNVGNRPTFGEESFAVESHILNFHPLGLNPATEIEVFFLRRLRDEMKFPSVEDLRRQIARDVASAQRYLRLAPSAC